MASDIPLGDPGAVGEHLVWHQELICMGASCRGRVRRFPPGVLVEGGRRERRVCPACGVIALVPAFYLADSTGAHEEERLPSGTAPPPAPHGPFHAGSPAT